MHHGGAKGFIGRADGFWFLFSSVCVLTVCLLVLMEDSMSPLKQGTLASANIAEGVVDDSEEMKANSTNKTLGSQPVVDVAV